MRYLCGCLTLLITTSLLAFLPPLKPSYADVEVQLELTPGFLNSGVQRSAAEDSLSPTPTTFRSLAGGGGFIFFFNKFVGLGSSVSTGITSARAENTAFLKLYNYTVIMPAISARWRSRSTAADWGIYLSVGPNLALLDLHGDFKEVLQSTSSNTIVFSENASGWGWFARLQLRFFVQKWFFVSFGLEWQRVAPRFDNAAESLSGGYLNIPVGIGLAFEF